MGIGMKNMHIIIWTCFRATTTAPKGSIAKLLRDLEDPPAKSSRLLFQGGGSTHLYAALLQGS